MTYIINMTSFLFIASMLMGASCFAAPLPDLIPTSISYDSTSGNFTSVVLNQGNAATPTGVTIGVAYLVDGVKCTWGYVIGPLAPSASVTIGTQGGACPISSGTHTITVFADDANRIVESDKTNNKLSQTLGSLPDLVPTSVSYNNGNFTSVIANQGNAPTPTGVTIGVAYLVDGVKQTWGYVIGPLAAGASATIGTQGGAYMIPNGTHTMTVVADDVNRMAESNKNNNTLSQPITVGSPPPPPPPPPSAGTVTIASLTAHNTTANPAYNQTSFAANFGTTSSVSPTQTITIDPTKMDRSMNPVTPGHVSRMNVHSLIPSRPDLRWFAHFMTWWGASNEPIHMGIDVNTDAYVRALVTDLRNRGFNGIEVSWNYFDPRADGVVKKIKAYVATLPAGSFSYMVNLDEGTINGQSNKQAVLETAINYLKANYFNDPNYVHEGGLPVLLFYGVRKNIGSASAMIAAKADTGGNMFWSDVDPSAGYLNESWEDAAFDWHDAWYGGVNQSDPYNLGAVGNFYSRVAAIPGKKGIGAMAGGYNETLVRPQEGAYLPHGSGAAIVQRARFINTRIPANVTMMHWVTWNDYPEGTSVEPGAENNVRVTASVRASTVNWTYTSGTGDESTIDHYEIYASANGIDAADLGSMPAGLHSFSLGSRGLTSGTLYNIMVVAVGKPCIRDHVSDSASFTAP